MVHFGVIFVSLHCVVNVSKSLTITPSPLSRPTVASRSFITASSSSTLIQNQKTHLFAGPSSFQIGARLHDRFTSMNNARLKSTSLQSTASKSSFSNNPEKTKTFISKRNILTAALLVSGTTIGGGFLALPTVTDPIGFVPSSITMFGVWLYFLFQSFILVEAIQITRETKRLKEDQESDQSLSLSLSTNNNPGISTVAKNVFGRTGQIMIGVLLTILIEATLVSQISRAGLMMMLYDQTNYSYKIGCALSSISIALLVFGPERRGIEVASKMNSVLTIGILMSVLGIIGCGKQYADWSRLGLGSIGSGLVDIGKVSRAIPSFLQVLGYFEIIPVVCELLKYDAKLIRPAILLGSFLPLCLQISFSGLGISLFSSTASSTLVGNDIVNVLLQKGGNVRIPLLSLAATAILSTILGCYLALLTMFNSMYEKISSKNSVKVINDEIETKDVNKFASKTLRQRLVVGSMIALPGLSIASTSPTMFLKAIDFAGSYPVLLLWGVLPPLMVLIQRFRLHTTKNISLTRKNIASSGPTSWLIFMLTLSMSMVGINIKKGL